MSEPSSPAPPAAPAPRSSSVVRRVVGVMLVAIVLYGAFVIYRGVEPVRARLASYAWWTFAAACGLAFSNYLLRFLKWEYYLKVLDIRGIPKGESLLTFLSGFVLTVTPGKLGEVFKSLVLFQTRGIPIERTAPIVVAERATDVIGVIAMITIGSTGFSGGIWWAVAGTVLVVGLLVFIAFPGLSAPLIARLGRFGRFGARVAPKLEAAMGHLRLLTTPRRLVIPTLLSFVGWSLEGLALWLILRGFDQTTPVTLAIFFYSTATLAGAVIPIPGGLGVVDGLIEQQLVQLGSVAPDAALGTMLLIRLATLWFAVAVGFVALGLLRLRYRGLEIGGAPPPARPGDAPRGDRP
ncbi:MAG: flippase-like domain-containing protein [Polyangiaceae bacterium]|nr:flippase-like domain-containing protein [Polyangiaceae bacterium]